MEEKLGQVYWRRIQFILSWCAWEAKWGGCCEGYAGSVLEVKSVRVMNLRNLEMEGMMLNVVRAYASQVEREMDEKDGFWSVLDAECSHVSESCDWEQG